MFRKTAIVLALAASFLGAQAMDLPKPARELTNKNKTKSAKVTAPKNGGFTKSNQCKNAAKTFVQCAVFNEYASSDGTWADKDCDRKYEAASGDCLAFAWEKVNKNELGETIPAYVAAGTISKAATVEGYVAVPSSNNGDKATAINCKACVAVIKKLMPCVLPITVAAGATDAEIYVALDAKFEECVDKADDLDTVIAYACYPGAINWSVNSGQLTWLSAVPQLTLGGQNGILLEDCPTVQGSLKRNGAVTAKVLKGSGYYFEII